MIDFPEQDLPDFTERATGLAQSWSQIREITLHPYLDDPDFTSKHSFVIVIQHNGSFHGVEEGKFLEHVCGFLHKTNFSNKQYDECLICPIGPDEPFPERAVRDVSTTLYKREGTNEDDALRQRTQPIEETPEERLQLEQEEYDRKRDEYFIGSDIRISEEKKKELTARLLLGRKPQPPISSLTPAEINEMRARMSQPPLSAKILKEMTATEKAPHWRIKAKEAMKPTHPLLEHVQSTPETPDMQKKLSDSKPIPKPRVAIVYDEAAKLRRDNPSMDKAMAKRRIDHILQTHKYLPYGRTQFNRIIEDLHFPPARRGPKQAKLKK